MNICGSYGLNEEETNQLILEFKRGALYQSQHSEQDSLSQTLSEMTFTDKPESEEYSFKHPQSTSPNIPSSFHRKDWIDLDNNQIHPQKIEKTESY